MKQAKVENSRKAVKYRSELANSLEQQEGRASSLLH